MVKKKIYKAISPLRSLETIQEDTLNRYEASAANADCIKGSRQDIFTEINISKYNKYIPKHNYRKTIYLKFLELLTNFYKKHLEIKLFPEENTNIENLQKMALNIEKAIFNHTLIVYPVTEWNELFKYWYHQKLVTIYTNLNQDSYLKNSNLIIRYFAKEFTEDQLMYFMGDRLFPEKYNEYYIEYKKSLPGEIVKEEIPDGLFTCGKCKSKKTTYYQLQTRSAKIGWKSTLLITSWLCYWKNS